MRGEHDLARAVKNVTSGSSPHARGALVEHVFAARQIGIIPACAGSTTASRSRSGASWDHPRMRGEHLERILTVDMSEGSSPHARGAPRRPGPQGVRGGIIPACAGSTAKDVWKAGQEGDHPRMRGEHSGESPAWGMSQGSAPHARGARRLGRRGARRAGIIPACAGSTLDACAAICAA